jgi:hypothetical protein
MKNDVDEFEKQHALFRFSFLFTVAASAKVVIASSKNV